MREIWYEVCRMCDTLLLYSNELNLSTVTVVCLIFRRKFLSFAEVDREGRVEVIWS